MNEVPRNYEPKPEVFFPPFFEDEVEEFLAAVEEMEVEPPLNFN